MGLFLDENGFVPALQEMASPSVTFVECLGIYTVELPHTYGQVAIRGLNQEVVMLCEAQDYVKLSSYPL